MVLGKRMEDWLRVGVCFWHSFAWDGRDMFGLGTLERPWLADGVEPMAAARHKMAAAFEFFTKLGIRYYCFHDRDVAPEGSSFAEFTANLDALVDDAEARQEATGVKLLWGTANLFSHPRYQAGASTNPDPEVFAYAAAQVRHMLEITKRLGGTNYVLWGGREGYETLLNTDLRRELDQLGRFMSMVVEHKHKIGFAGTLLIEPKPQEPTKHQYDFDVASIFGFLKAYGLENEIKLNIEANHATLAGHSFEHEIALATALGIFGSLDINRGDPQSGWDTDQFPNSVPEVALALHYVLRDGGFSTGGLNFDAKIRRQSLDPADLLYAHIGGMDVCARGLLAAAAMIEDGSLARHFEERYASWDSEEGQAVLDGARSLEELAARVERTGLDPQPVSGRQEYLENLVNRFV
jgi:xylose isomerase